MDITKLIGKKNNAKKLAAIVEVVANARAKYNNEDAEIKAPTVNTCSGGQSIKYVSDEDKAALATVELKKILSDISCLDAQMEGVNIKRELTGLIATNPVLVNLEASMTLGLE